MNRFFLLLKESLLEKKFVILILGGVLGLLSYFIVYMIEGMDLSAIEDIIALWPEEMLGFFGDVEVFTSPYGFWTLELLTFMWAYAGIYIVYMASNLLTREVETKIIDLSLSKPVTRYNFLGSKIAFLYLFIVAALGIFFLLTMAGVAFSSVFQDEGLFFDRLWLTYIIVVLYLGALAMFAKFFSTIFLSGRKAMAFGIGILFIMFFLGEFYVYMDEAVQGMKYISVFYYFNPSDYMVHADFGLFARDLIVLGSINAALVVGSLLIFNKKDIPI
ncbi:MAG: ABC transporter permease subunit [Candidatus Lokiarchaeota archaeon]|nr:ABC transporter permease subunit [Candidatus Lokiarchaeota archaeon]